MQSSVKALILTFFVLILVSAKPDKRPFNEAYRPQFHFSPEKNWLLDPSGIVYLDGTYHMFFQLNPFGEDIEFTQLGHATSEDLVHWKHWPVAIQPDGKSDNNERCSVLSGCAFVDDKNILGLNGETTQALVLFYSNDKCGQRIAYTLDNGNTWNKYDQHPKLPVEDDEKVLDPNIFWHQPSSQYMMVVSRMPDGEERKKGASIYSSKNLIDWSFVNHIPGFYDSPNLIEIPVNRRPDDIRWVLIDGDGSYLIGQFDGKDFTPESGKLKGDFGKNYYATKAWDDASEGGRIIQLTSMPGGEFPEMEFNGQMNFPCELGLKKYKEGIRMVRTPIKEIETIHEKGKHFEEKNLIPGLENKNLLKGIKGDCFHLIGTFDLKTVNSFGFMIRHSKKKIGTEIRYDATKNMLNCLGCSAPLQPEDGKIKLEILVDRSSIEIFANDGKTVMSCCFAPEQDMKDLVLYNTGGELYVEKLDVYPLKSIYAYE